MRLSRTSTTSQAETILSVKSTSSGVGFSPATSACISSSRATRATSIRGSPAAMVSASIRCPVRAKSEARATISGEDSRSACRSSRIASLSPSLALSESTSSSASLSFTSFDSLSAVFTCSPPPFSSSFMKASGDQVCLAEDLGRLLKLAYECCILFEAFPLLSPVGSLFLPLSALNLIKLGGQPSDRPAADVLPDHASTLPPGAGVVAPWPLLTRLPAHKQPQSRSRGSEKDVTQHAPPAPGRLRHLLCSLLLDLVAHADTPSFVSVFFRICLLFVSLRPLFASPPAAPAARKPRPTTPQEIARTFCSERVRFSLRSRITLHPSSSRRSERSAEP